MTGNSNGDGQLRIGELSRRVGVSAELLRAWERRYGLLSPARTAGGFRLYDATDERRIRRMLAHLDDGLSAAEAARLTLEEPDVDDADARAGWASSRIADDLRQALDQFDEAGAHEALDRLLSTFTLETVIRDAVIPYLHELGERWGTGDASVAQEHFASALIRGRLLGPARGWGGGSGPLALLACVPGDQHDLGLICFGLALRGHGWRIAFLGPDTPLATVIETAAVLRPALVVLTSTMTEHTAEAETGLAQLGLSSPLALAGTGATPAIARRVGARYLDDDPVTAAGRLAGGWPEQG